MKTICITIPESLLRSVDGAARRSKRTRSEICRTALSAWLRSSQRARMVREEHEGYGAHPVQRDEFEGLIAAQTFDEDADEDGEGR